MVEKENQPNLRKYLAPFYKIQNSFEYLDFEFWICLGFSVLNFET